MINTQHVYKGATHAIHTSVISIYYDLLERLPLIVAGIIFIILTWIVAKIVYKIVGRSLKNKKKLRPSLKEIIHQASSTIVWIIGIVITIIIIFPGVTPAKIVAGLGIGTIAIGFAFKDIVENFLAGIIILWSFPMKSGDYIKCGDVEGIIEKITIRSTKIRVVNGELILLPNAILFKDPVKIMTNKPLYRNKIICGVSYDAKIAVARKIIKDAVESCQLVSKEYEVKVSAHEFADSSINFVITWWCQSTMGYIRTSKDEVIEKIKDALDDAGIEIPFPQRTLSFEKSANLKVEQK